MAAENRGPTTPVGPDPAKRGVGLGAAPGKGASTPPPGGEGGLAPPSAAVPSVDAPAAESPIVLAKAGSGIGLELDSAGIFAAALAASSEPAPLPPPPMKSDPKEIARKAMEQAAKFAAREAVYRPKAPLRPPANKLPLAEFLAEEPFKFDFFQAVRILEKHRPDLSPVGGVAPPRNEVVRFVSYPSLVFPASSIQEYRPASELHPTAELSINFMGLHGPSGVLPAIYTDLILRLRRDVRGPERYALRDFFDLFNHRLISLFHRAWAKYRFYVPFERGEFLKQEQDLFTQCVFSLVGLGTGSLRGRMRVARWAPAVMPAAAGPDATAEEISAVAHAPSLSGSTTIAEVDDLAVLHYAGLLSHHPRNAVGLETMLRDYFNLPAKVEQFRPQWLKLDADSQSRLGLGSCLLGQDAILGERVLDVQGKFRVVLGPLTYGHFSRFLPDRTDTPSRKAFFLLVHLTRLYAGPEFDFEAQLVLKSEEVPPCVLTDDPHSGPRLGWNTWLHSKPLPQDAGDAVFQASELYWVNEAEALAGRAREA